MVTIGMATVVKSEVIPFKARKNLSTDMLWLDIKTQMFLFRQNMKKKVMSVDFGLKLNKSKTMSE